MSDYKSIIGKPLKFVTANLDNDQAEGQIWYNSTTGEFKDVIINEAWASGSPGIQARRLAGGFGIQTATVAVGGVGPNPTVFDDTEHYNGSGWSAAEDYPSLAYGVAGCGTQTAGLAWGGKFPPAYSDTSNTYNGSSWTSAPTLNTARAHTSNNIGAQTSALCAGGGEPLKAVTEEFDGSSWSESGDLSTARQGMAAGGTQTASFVAGGEGPAPGAVALTEEYNGTSWTAGGALNTARIFVSGTGPLTAGIAFAGGEPSNSNKTEKYDGTTWSVAPTLGTARQAGMGAGADNTSALAAFGATGPTALLSISEEFTSSVNVITAAAWASGPAINDARLTKNNGLGPTSASLIFGGNPGTAPYASNSTEEYDGSSWTNGGAYPSSASEVSGAAGTQTAALGFAQSASPTSNVANYDGTSWTVNPATFPAGSAGVGTGEQSAAIYSGNSSTNSLEWDNTSWTAGGTMNTARTGHGAGFGNTTSAMCATGRDSPTTSTADSEEYDGTTWTSVGNVITARKRLNASKPLSNASGYIFGGTPPTSNAGPTFTSTELWNGTNWSTAPNLGTATGNQFGAGTTDAFSIGGQPNPPITSATEIFTPESTALNIKTISTS